jgi:N6-adenosine-specific RNA methylase IME4
VKYGVILADPPWSYNNAGTRGAAALVYPTMSDADIAALPVGDMAASDCVLLLWGTWPKLLEGCMAALDGWGFAYVTGFPWIKVEEVSRDLWGELKIKTRYGLGFWARGTSEPLLIARRGDPKPPPDGFIGLLSPNLAHSRKPESIYHYAEAMPGPYLELFARRPRAGWDSWGNEITSTIVMPDGAEAAP